MSEKEKNNWEELKKKLEERGYLGAEKTGFFIKFTLDPFSYFASLLRLSFLFSVISSFLISFVFFSGISILQKKFLPVLLIYFFPLFFILFFGIIPLSNLIYRIKPIKNPFLFSVYTAFIISTLCSFLVFYNFKNFLPEKFRYFSIFLLIFLFFLIFYPPFKALSFLSWREIPLNFPFRAKKIIFLIFISVFGILIFFAFKENKIEEISVPISKNFNKLAFIGFDGFPRSEKLLEEFGISPILKESLVFELNLKEKINPPIFWTEVSTGFKSIENGFLNLKVYKLPFIKNEIYPLPLAFIFEKFGIAKESISVKGSRKKRTFWEISSYFGRHTISLNWWTSWEPIDPSGELISNIYFIKILKKEKSKEYKFLNEFDFEVKEGPFGFLWNQAVFEATKKYFKNQDLFTAYFPGLDVQMEEIKKGEIEKIMENSKFIEENLKILKDLIDFFKDKNYKILFLSYSARMKEVWGWGFLYPNLKNLKLNEKISHLSIAPTILKALNLPLSEKFSFKPIPLPFNESMEYYIKDYPAPERKFYPGTKVPFEELKSLGYLK